MLYAYLMNLNCKLISGKSLNSGDCYDAFVDNSSISMIQMHTVSNLFSKYTCHVRMQLLTDKQVVVIFLLLQGDFVQVVGGTARRKKLLSPKSMDVRPMMEVVKAAAFGILQVRFLLAIKSSSSFK